MEKLNNIMNEAKTLRDTLKVQTNLAKLELEDEFKDLESKYESIQAKSKKIAEAAGDSAEELRIAAELGINVKSKDDLNAALELSAEEIKKGYEKIKKII